MYVEGTKITASVRGNFSGTTKIFDAVWDDAWFSKNSGEYISDLANTSALLSAACADNGRYAEDALKDLGFTQVKSVYKEATEESNDTVAFTGGIKFIDAALLVALTIRGTAGYEWYSNFNIGEDTVHAGFENAASYVKKLLLSALNENPDSKAALENDNVYFYLTGTSRGAAVANILAKQFSDEYGADKVRAYTFATPNVAKDTEETEYKNIFNIINPEDFIPRILLDGWGFGRYGITLSLPTASYTGANYSALYSQMNSVFKTIMGSDHQGFNGLIQVETVLNDLYSKLPTLQDFNTKELKLDADTTITAAEFFRQYAVHQIDSKDKSFTGTLSKSISAGQTVSDFYYLGIYFTTYPNQLWMAHSIGTTFSYLKSCTSYELFGMSKPSASTSKRFTRYQIPVSSVSVTSGLSHMENSVAVLTLGTTTIVDIPYDMTATISASSSTNIQYTSSDFTFDADKSLSTSDHQESKTANTVNGYITINQRSQLAKM